MWGFLHILRPKNLLIIAFVQVLAYSCFFPYIFETSKALILKGYLFPLLVFDTILLAAGAYLINDIFDFNIDRINKGSDQIAGKGLSIKTCKLYYAIISVLGMMLAFYIAISINQPGLFIIYPMVWGLLLMYSWKWKKAGIFGNIVVSLFTGFVPFIIFFAERDFFSGLTPNDTFELGVQISGLITFAFLSNLIREIVKDAEDIEGDRIHGSKSLAITKGTNYVNIVCIVLSLILAILAIAYLYVYPLITIWHYLILLLVLLLIFGIIRSLQKAQESKDYKRISALLKVVMVVGIFIFIV